MNILSIDIGGTKISAGLITADNRLIERRQIETPASASPDELKRALAYIIEPLRAHAERIAVASTGIILNGVLTALNPDNLGGLKNFPLRDSLQELSGLPCGVINDAQAAAWAEFSHYDIPDMAFITVSTGVGGGIILQGRLITGRHGLAGHLGHTLADPNGPLCGCGRKGCIEAVASGRAIASQAKDELAGLTAKDIFSHFHRGNLQAKTLVNHSAQAIANLACDVKAAIDIQCVVIGGSVGLAAGYLERVRHVMNEIPEALRVDILPAHFQSDAGLIGAALWVRTQ